MSWQAGVVVADVFISYKREDEAVVGRLVKALRGDGLSVWWDRDIPTGAPWEDTIEREHEAARALVVCWSKAAVASENVKAEARRARSRNRLVQTFVEACEPPMFFGERQGVDLSGWSGRTDDPRFKAARLEYEAEWQRFQLVRDALLVSRGLHHTNYRPTAWWLPLVSPDGAWFNALVSTTQARIEEL